MARWAATRSANVRSWEPARTVNPPAARAATEISGTSRRPCLKGDLPQGRAGLARRITPNSTTKGLSRPQKSSGSEPAGSQAGGTDPDPQPSPVGAACEVVAELAGRGGGGVDPEVEAAESPFGAPGIGSVARGAEEVHVGVGAGTGPSASREAVPLVPEA